MRFRIIFTCILDLAIWAIALWLLTARPGDPLVPRVWLHTYRTCGWLAAWFGSLAIEAEANYWKAIRA